jgi:glycosyltransferase involved in cell wall biosynthesis
LAFVFWQNVASRHQRDLLRAIAAASGHEVMCAVEGELPAGRAAFGWGGEDFAPVKLVRSSDRATFESLVARTGDTHVLTGFRHHPVIRKAFTALARSGAAIHLQSESVDIHGAPGAIRVVRDRLKAVRHRKHVRGVFAIGMEAMRYFSRLGFRPAQIVPFGYFVACPASGQSRPDDLSVFRVVFVGQLVRRKGVDLLLAALARVSNLPWQLELIGAGSEEAGLKTRADRLGLARRVVWKGPVAPARIYAELAGADLLVLPSRWDGWGVVVNEALASGVPVVCNDRCGAAAVLTSLEIGDVLPACDIGVLASVLRRRIGAGRIAQSTRASCQAAAAALTPETGARQFLDGIAAIETGAMPPPAPWLRNQEDLR